MLQCGGLHGAQADRHRCFLFDRDETTPGRLECLLRDRGGQQIPVLKSASVLKDANGAAIGLVESITDLRPLKYLEQRVEEIGDAFVPMFFITGRMGPYMAPMALNVPVAMLMSLLVAFTITPWLSYHLLRKSAERATHAHFVLEQTWLYRTYQAIMNPIFASRGRRWAILGGIGLLMVFAAGLVLTKRVPLKMLPFDNKNELQVVINMPEGTPLETTEAAAHGFAQYLVRVPEVTDVTTYAGLSRPVDFSGLIRHYYLRQGGHVADVRFNLAGIATRNAILLVEFVEERKKEGKPLQQSLLEAGALRTRAILLTSLAAMLGAWPITLDPIFSGLAWALIFGLLVSTLFTLVVVPMIYYMAYGRPAPAQA
ncbi:MAG: efflux RND transporter permease subunit [Planctomycetes bacterium]|jgi:multidrug efflux pump subunit AcrB|nr:efflux RND transporter permease subunit [Planctomycetota bacterium]